MNFTQNPTLSRLIDFEKASWPTEELASPAEIEQRIKRFPEGIFILNNGKQDVCQVTVSPKTVSDYSKITSFEAMRDQTVNRRSKTLWVTNLATRPSARGNGYAKELLAYVARWAKENGYARIVAGVTCDDLQELRTNGEVKSVVEYLEQDRNPALKTFRATAKAVGARFVHSQPIANYWPTNKTSEGYGVLVAIEFPRGRRAK